MAKYPAIVKGDFGMTIEVDTGIALAGYTVSMKFRKPGATTWLTKAGSIADTTKISYTVPEADNLFDTVGEVKVEALAVDGTTNLTSAKSAILPVVEEGQL